MTTPDRASPVAWIAGALDLVLVVVFALAGRRTHDSDLVSVDSLETLWPFVLGLALGWMITRAWRHPVAPVGAGIGIWLCTVGGGMVLRAVSGQGTALPFVIVATGALALALVGWRAIARLTRTRGDKEFVA